MRLSIFALAAAGFGFGVTPAFGRQTGRLRGLPPEHRRRDTVSELVATGSQAATSSSGNTQSATPTSVDVQLPPAPATIPSSAPTPAPTPLDTSISLVLSQSCLVYLSGVLMTPEFTSCLPFSLLLSTSNGFKSQVASATKLGNYSYINELIAYVSSPQPSSETCDKLFASYLPEFQDDKNCGKDLAQRVPTARQARRGFGNYAVMREAASLVNPSTGVYCYLEAIASPRADDTYLWMLPSGNILPPSSTPTCSDCSALLMNHYGTWSSNTTTLNSTILNSAASAINNKCGSNFISVIASPDQSADSNGTRGLHKDIALWLPFVSILAWVFMS